jgi:hypothetical protein
MNVYMHARTLQDTEHAVLCAKIQWDRLSQRIHEHRNIQSHTEMQYPYTSKHTAGEREHCFMRHQHAKRIYTRTPSDTARPTAHGTDALVSTSSACTCKFKYDTEGHVTGGPHT